VQCMRTGAGEDFYSFDPNLTRFGQRKLKTSHKNLRFGQNKSVEGKKIYNIDVGQNLI